MKYFLIDKKLFVLTLICLAGFLVFPNISLADEFNDITLREAAKYLELPAGKVQELIRSLISIFNSEWEDLMTSRWYSPPYPTPEEMAVPSIMKKAVQVQALNHLLIDAPIQTIWAIVKNATKIARVFLAKDPSIILDELEKESVEKAIGYGMSVLLENEIRMSPGVIEFEYKQKEGETEKVFIQYIMIYKPFDAKNGEVVVRFYSAESLKPPKNEMSYGGIWGIYTELEHDLPPFIVDIRGTVEDYQWVGQPSMKIDFPPEVSDLGIKPLSWWEKYVLKPIESTIKETEILITKVTGKSLGLTDIWEKVKSFISKITTFFPAALVQTPEVKESPSATKEASNAESQPVMPEPQLEPQPEPEPKPETKPQSQQLALAELQEMLDDLAEKIDIFSRQVSELVEAKKQQTEKEIEEVEEEEILDKDLDKNEKKDTLCFIKSININTAPKEELQKIIGVGMVIAQRIIEARPFYSLNDLIKVNGIGEKTLQNIINQGCAYVDSIYAGSGSATAQVSDSPQVTLNYSKESPINKEIEAILSASNLKNTTYDVKISIENGTTTLSEIFNEKENKWQNSYNYLTEVFSGTSFSGDFKLKLKDAENSFRGEADIFSRVRESGKSSYLEFKGKINITDPWQATSTPTQEEVPPLAIVINEIAWMGTKANTADEWIEIHNTTKSEIDLTGWKLVSVTDNSPNITLGRTISGLGFYLLERTDDFSVSDILADKIYTGALKNNPDCEILSLYDQNNNLIDQTGCLENGNWPAGKASPDYISIERINPRLSGEDSSNWANNNQTIRNGLDAEDNPINGTPRAQNSVYQSLPPADIIDLAIDFQNRSDNKVTLIWSAPEGPDTLPENLSYKIYYSKEGTLVEDNLTASSTFFATTSATTILISDLDYNSTYYFALKAFDGQNYSELSNVVSYQIPSALVNSAWPRFKKDSQRSGQSDFLGPQAALTVLWVYNEEINTNNPDLNPLYTSPIIRPEGTIFSSVIYPSDKKGILALNSDGSKKWFQEENIDFPLALQTDGSVLADDISRAWSNDETVYYLGQNDTLYAFDKNGNEKWQRQFLFEDPQQFGCSSTTPSVLTPAVGKDGIIYVVVQNNACSSQWDKVDYLYAISSENGDDIWAPVNLGGYNSSLPTVSDDNTAYVLNLTYPVGYPILWLKAIFNGEIRWTKSFDNNFKSLPIVDSQGNIYFSIGKKVYGFDKEGGEIWQIYLVEAPSNWEVVSGFLNGLALSTDGVLYLSGRGAIFVLK